MFFAGLGAFYKYGDRTDVFEKNLAGTNLALRTLRKDIAFKLALRLKPVFDGASAVVEIDLVNAAGNPISEVSVNPVGSENYNDALFDFVEGNDISLVHYKLLLSACDRWCWWATFLSQAILILISAEFLLSVPLLWAKLVGHVFSDSLLVSGFCVTGTLILCCLAPLFFLHSEHNKIAGFRKQYAMP